MRPTLQGLWEQSSQGLLGMLALAPFLGGDALRVPEDVGEIRRVAVAELIGDLNLTLAADDAVIFSSSTRRRRRCFTLNMAMSYARLGGLLCLNRGAFV